MTHQDSRTSVGSIPGRARVEDISVVILDQVPDGDILGLLDTLIATGPLPQRLLLTHCDPDSERFDQIRAHLADGPWGQVPLLARAPLPSTSPDSGQVTAWRVLQDAWQALPVHEGHWIWNLSTGSRPTSGSLAALVAAVRRNSRVGIVGPKLVDRDDPRLLLSVGHHLTAAGRSADAPELSLVDQGQFDQRQDVLGVPLVGALMRSDVIAQIGGIDPDFSGDGIAGLDLSWRTHLAGHRVMIVPEAVIAQDARALGALDPLRTRVRHRQMALARGSLLAAPWRALGVLLTSLLAAAALLLVKRPAAARGEWADVQAVLTPLRGWRARARFRGVRTVKHKDLHGLFAPRHTGGRQVLDVIGEALDPRDRRRVQERAGASAAATGPLSDEFSDLATPTRDSSWWRRRWPLVTALLTVSVAVFLRWRELLPGLSPSAAGVQGGELGPAFTNSTGLLHSLLDGWRGQGLGHQVSAEAWLLPLSALARGAEIVGAGASSAGLALAWLLLLAAPASVLSAYVGLRRATRRRWLRAALALCWAGIAPLTSALEQGRVGPVIVHIAAPVLLAGYAVCAARVGGARRTAALFAVVLLVVLIAWWVPSMLVLASLAGLLLLVAGRGQARWRGAVLAVLPWALYGPGLVSFIGAPQLLATGAGASIGSPYFPSPTPAWQLALLQPAGRLDPAGLEAVPLWLMIPLWLLGLGALLLPGPAGARAAIWIATALTGLALALGSGWLSWGRQAEPASSSWLEVMTWPGTFLSLTAAGLMLSSALLLDVLLPRATEEDSSEAQTPASRAAAEELRHQSQRRTVHHVVGVVASVLLIGSGIVALAWPMLNGHEGQELQVAQAELPAVAVEQSRGPTAMRTLVLGAAAGGLEERPEPESSNESESGGADPSSLDTSLADPAQEGWLAVRLIGPEPEPARILRDGVRNLTGQWIQDSDRTRLEGTVAALTGQGSPEGVMDRLTDLGVGYVLAQVVDDGVLASQIDRVPGLTRVSSPPGQVMWRVIDNQAARARMVDAEGNLLRHIPVSGAHGHVDSTLMQVPHGARLIVAEGQGWATQARISLDGEEVRVDEQGRVELPAGDTQLAIELRRPTLPWHLLSGALLIITGFLALPFGRREEGQEVR